MALMPCTVSWEALASKNLHSCVCVRVCVCVCVCTRDAMHSELRGVGSQEPKCNAYACVILLGRKCSLRAGLLLALVLVPCLALTVCHVCVCVCVCASIRAYARLHLCVHRATQTGPRNAPFQFSTRIAATYQRCLMKVSWRMTTRRSRLTHTYIRRCTRHTHPHPPTHTHTHPHSHTHIIKQPNTEHPPVRQGRIFQGC